MGLSEVKIEGLYSSAGRIFPDFTESNTHLDVTYYCFMRSRSVTHVPLSSSTVANGFKLLVANGKIICDNMRSFLSVVMVVFTTVLDYQLAYIMIANAIGAAVN